MLSRRVGKHSSLGGSDVHLLCEDCDSDVMSYIRVMGEYHHLVIDDINHE